jgi:hypothetical protein
VRRQLGIVSAKLYSVWLPLVPRPLQRLKKIMMSPVNPVSVERALPAEVENSTVFAAEKAIIEEVEEAWDAETIFNLNQKNMISRSGGDTIVRASVK